MKRIKRKRVSPHTRSSRHTVRLADGTRIPTNQMGIRARDGSIAIWDKPVTDPMRRRVWLGPPVEPFVDDDGEVLTPLIPPLPPSLDLDPPLAHIRAMR